MHSAEEIAEQIIEQVEAEGAVTGTVDIVWLDRAKHMMIAAIIADRASRGIVDEEIGGL